MWSNLDLLWAQLKHNTQQIRMPLSSPCMRNKTTRARHKSAIDCICTILTKGVFECVMRNAWALHLQFIICRTIKNTQGAIGHHHSFRPNRDWIENNSIKNVYYISLAFAMFIPISQWKHEATKMRKNRDQFIIFHPFVQSSLILGHLYWANSFHSDAFWCSIFSYGLQCKRDGDGLQILTFSFDLKSFQLFNYALTWDRHIWRIEISFWSTWSRSIRFWCTACGASPLDSKW